MEPELVTVDVNIFFYLRLRYLILITIKKCLHMLRLDHSELKKSR